MSTRSKFSRLFPALAMVLALFALGSFVVPAGCGGGSKETAKKKKKKKKSADEGGKKDDGGGEMDQTQMEIELIKDQFTGVYTEFYGGNATPAQLYKALLEAEKKLEDYDKAKWGDFDTMVKGRFYAHVDLAEWLLKNKKAEAFANLDDLEGAKKHLQEAADFLEVVDRSKIEKLKMGENDVDYPQFFDDAKAQIADAFKELEVMSAIVKRTPPSGESINLCDADDELWEKEGDIDFAAASGEMMLEAKGDQARVTSVHYFLKDFSLKFTFMITQGGFDIMLRALPGKGSPFFAGFNKEDLPDPNAPFTMVLTVSGNSCTITDTEGRELCDPINVDPAPSGGGIGIKLRGKGSSMVIQELLLEPK